METQKNAKKMQKFFCEKCDFSTSNKTNYKIHLQTQKHNGNKMETFGNKKCTKMTQCFICDDEWLQIIAIYV